MKSPAHFSLRWPFNLFLLLVWTALAAAIARRWLLPFFGLGVVAGAIAGLLQRSGLQENRDAFLRAATAREVRDLFQATRAGRHYRFLFWAKTFGFALFAAGDALHFQDKAPLYRAVAFAVDLFAAQVAYAWAREAIALPTIVSLNSKPK